MNTTELGVLETQTDMETPKVVNLEFQTDAAEDTLVLGSIRRVDWSDPSFSVRSIIQAGVHSA